MISTRNFVPALLLVLAACGATDAPTRSPDDWRAALDAGDGVGAEIALRKALDAGEEPGELAPYLGEAEMVQGDLREARRWLTGGTFAPTVAAHGFHMLGRLELREGRLPEAGKAFDRALAANDRIPSLWVDIARLRWRGGEQAQASAASEKAIELGPVDPAALLLRAQMIRDAQGNAAALPFFERGLKAAPSDPDILADYAATLGELGRARESLAAIRRFALAAPGDKRALYFQAVVAARAGSYDLARSLLQRSGDLDRDMPAAILLLALVDLENGNPASAAQGFDRLARQQPDNPHVAALLALALTEAGSDRELVARFGGRADDRYLALLVGRAYERLGEREKAAEFLDRANSRTDFARTAPLAPLTSLDVARTRGMAEGANAVALVRGLIASGDLGGAQTAATAWLARYPGSADAMALAGDAALASRNAEAAMRHYRQAAEIRRAWPLTKRMAAAMEAMGDAAGAEALVAAHLAGEPNNGEAAALLAHRMMARGDTARAGRLRDHVRKRGS